jgi:hypothetical protein
MVHLDVSILLPERSESPANLAEVNMASIVNLPLSHVDYQKQRETIQTEVSVDLIVSTIRHCHILLLSSYIFAGASLSHKLVAVHNQIWLRR